MAFESGYIGTTGSETSALCVQPKATSLTLDNIGAVVSKGTTSTFHLGVAAVVIILDGEGLQSHSTGGLNV